MMTWKRLRQDIPPNPIVRLPKDLLTYCLEFLVSTETAWEGLEDLRKFALVSKFFRMGARFTLRVINRRHSYKWYDLALFHRYVHEMFRNETKVYQTTMLQTLKCIPLKRRHMLTDELDCEPVTNPHYRSQTASLYIVDDIVSMLRQMYPCLNDLQQAQKQYNDEQIRKLDAKKVRAARVTQTTSFFTDFCQLHWANHVAADHNGKLLIVRTLWGAKRKTARLPKRFDFPTCSIAEWRTQVGWSTLTESWSPSFPEYLAHMSEEAKEAEEEEEEEEWEDDDLCACGNLPAWECSMLRCRNCCTDESCARHNNIFI
jgi:hypothetical protein